MGKFVNKYTYETAKEFVESCNCEFLSDNYCGMNEKYNFRCMCGSCFTTTFAKFQNRNKRQCNKCGRKGTPQTKPLDINYVSNYFKMYDCELISNNYENYHTDLVAICSCGREFYTSYAKFRNSKHQCQECSQRDANEFKCKYTYEYVNDLLKEHEEKLLTPKTSDYIIRKSDIEIKCSCGEIYTTQLAIVLDYDKYCCNECSFANISLSLGELKVHDYLVNNNIKFKEQYSFNDCKYKYVLRFDFAIFDINDNLICLCEYDGIQHFKPFDYYGGINTFNLIKIRDNIKNIYCMDNNIKLIRIPYTQINNIEEILNKELFNNQENEVAFCM